MDEEHKVAVVRMTSYHQIVMTQYNKKTQLSLFHVGDLVLRWVFENMVEIGARKLQPKWKDSYIVNKAGKSRAYH